MHCLRNMNWVPSLGEALIKDFLCLHGIQSRGLDWSQALSWYYSKQQLKPLWHSSCALNIISQRHHKVVVSCTKNQFGAGRWGQWKRWHHTGTLSRLKSNIGCLLHWQSSQVPARLRPSYSQRKHLPQTPTWTQTAVSGWHCCSFIWCTCLRLREFSECSSHSVPTQLVQPDTST